MKGKWYRSRPAKWILIGVSHVLTVLLVISLVWVANCPDSLERVFESKTLDYEETSAFGMEMLWDSVEIFEQNRIKNNFETDGEYDGSKLVDLKEYTDKETVSGENKNGLCYTLEELLAWGDAFTSGEIECTDMSDGMRDPIVVCQKKDGTYDYYYFSELQKKIDDGAIRFLADTEEMTSYDVLQELQAGDWYENSENTNKYLVMDEKGQVLYVNYWNYDGSWIEEMYAPDGADSLLEIVNTDERWNGKLQEAYVMIESTLNKIVEEKDKYDENMDAYAEGNTNLSYLYVDHQKKTIDTNCTEYTKYEDLDTYVAAMKKSGKYVLVMPKLKDFESNIEEADPNVWKEHMEAYMPEQEDYLYLVSVDTEYPIQDQYYSASLNYDMTSGKVVPFFVIGVASAVGLLVILIWLTIVAGRSVENEEIELNRFDRVKTEIGAALVVAVWGCLLAVLGSALDSFAMREAGNTGSYGGMYIYWTSPYVWICVCAIAAVTCSAFLIGWLSLVRRIKAKTLWENSILRWMLRAIRNGASWMIAYVPSRWKKLLLFAVFLLTQWLMMTREAVLVLIGLAAQVAAAVYLVRQEFGQKQIRDGVKKIAEGEVDYKIPTEELKGDAKETAEQINKIGEGLDAALDEILKNERLKTDLITNVSHDIKTPLTSIINYIDLLKRENFEDPKVREYLDVLEAKAQRLKTLTEDVVEASKVSSGNVNLQYMNLDLAEMIQQTSGEFSEKFEKRNLHEVLSLPKEPAIIRADSQRMWRVIENIYNNAAKYAMEGTRIYADLKVEEKTVVFSLKNISEQQLNISADELTERFVRGDLSRSTEGSGLGLSIAKNITELMHGTFEIYLDGDLFRVTITMPRE